MIDVYRNFIDLLLALFLGANVLTIPAAGTPHPVRPGGDVTNQPKAITVRGPWKLDKEISWYGPHFYGNRTACGLRLTRELVGVAHRTLPCGTLLEFRWKGKVVVTPVVDRGPYVQGRQFDLTRAACKAIEHCWTGPIYWRKVND